MGAERETESESSSEMCLLKEKHLAIPIPLLILSLFPFKLPVPILKNNIYSKCILYCVSDMCVYIHVLSAVLYSLTVI